MRCTNCYGTRPDCGVCGGVTYRLAQDAARSRKTNDPPPSPVRTRLLDPDYWREFCARAGSIGPSDWQDIAELRMDCVEAQKTRDDLWNFINKGGGTAAMVRTIVKYLREESRKTAKIYADDLKQDALAEAADTIERTWGTM